MNTKEGNVLIGKFMNWDFSTTKVQGDKLVPYLPRYDVLWDNLMPVVRALSISLPTIDNLELDYLKDELGFWLRFGEREKSYEYVVKLIEWYNENK